MKPIEPVQRRLDTARHEAGHVLPLLALGIPFKNVEILPKEITLETPNLGFVRIGDDLCLGVVRTDPVAFMLQGCRFPVCDQIIQALAGVAGEQIEYPRPIWNKRRDWAGRNSRARFDYEDAREIADRLSLGSLRPYFKEAWKFLQQHKAKHTALVAALLDKSLLTYDECVEIWRAQ
jgi:hypothetical protein